MKRILFNSFAIILLLVLFISTTAKAQTSQPDVSELDKADSGATAGDQVPQYPGGGDELFRFISKNTRYPKYASEHKIQGKVVLSFIVEKDGSLTNFKVVQSIFPALDDEALRVVKKLPKWKPGSQNGHFVRVLYTIPITFILPTM